MSHNPVTALGELYDGARKSARLRENLERLGALAAAAAVLTPDAETAAVYGELKATLRLNVLCYVIQTREENRQQLRFHRARTSIWECKRSGGNSTGAGFGFT